MATTKHVSYFSAKILADFWESRSKILTFTIFTVHVWGCFMELRSQIHSQASDKLLVTPHCCPPSPPISHFNICLFHHHTTTCTPICSSRTTLLYPVFTTSPSQSPLPSLLSQAPALTTLLPTNLFNSTLTTLPLTCSYTNCDSPCQPPHPYSNQSFHAHKSTPGLTTLCFIALF